MVGDFWESVKRTIKPVEVLLHVVEGVAEGLVVGFLVHGKEAGATSQRLVLATRP